jgi:hydroxymethylbilane synthase
MPNKYVIGTRGSALATWQAEFVKWLLEDHWPEDKFEIRKIKTTGDDLSLKISEAGGKGLYLKELEEALLRNQVDLCVHSMKDLPVELPDFCTIAAVLERGDVRDVFISRNKVPLERFTSEMRIGTSSLRRQSLLRALNIPSNIVEIRGNVDSRLKKMMEGEVDGLVLAGAGVLRLGLESHITEYLSPHTFVPAPAQGAIVIECRAEDDELRLKLRAIHDDESGQSTAAERAFLKGLGAHCALPLGAFCEIEQFQMRLHSFLALPDGSHVMMETAVGPVGHGEALGKHLAERMMAQGASRIMGALGV